VRGHVRAFESGDMSPHFHFATISEALLYSGSVGNVSAQMPNTFFPSQRPIDYHQLAAHVGHAYEKVWPM